MVYPRSNNNSSKKMSPRQRINLFQRKQTQRFLPEKSLMSLDLQEWVLRGDEARMNQRAFSHLSEMKNGCKQSGKNTKPQILLLFFLSSGLDKTEHDNYFQLNENITSSRLPSIMAHPSNLSPLGGFGVCKFKRLGVPPDCPDRVVHTAFSSTFPPITYQFPNSLLVFQSPRNPQRFHSSLAFGRTESWRDLRERERNYIVYFATIAIKHTVQRSKK